MQIHDKFVTLQFNIYTNLDWSTAATVPVYLHVVYDHPFEEDLIPFACVVTVDLTAPQQKFTACSLPANHITWSSAHLSGASVPRR
jgi:hypothetical protein